MTTQNPLIPLGSAEIDGVDGQQTVDARDLHAFLVVGTQFNKWIVRRIQDYGFEEEKDFCPILTKSSGGRPSREYHLSLDMAKELAMVERNERGKQARQYFIRCERQLKKQLHPDFTDPAEAALAWAEQYKRREALEHENVLMLPKSRFHDRIAHADGTHTVEEVAKMLRTGRNKLFKWLREEKFLTPGNLPYQPYLNQGLFRVVEKPFSKGGTTHLNRQTLITGKGLIVIQHRLDNNLLGKML
ncbi:MAG: antA/AntB antirepressor family protein [Hyphomicrobiaceae bacterium]|nr:antA/AntB antirepressor family protein [Hyphomicrobiaceae bacterium]